eukprot:TRINITY_DN16775_c0_g1_i1.p1 TRINITY_DN16775_c0_g1~~TRINITY_DN16775_c0_g1_i1.p1  ORF type:complete len:319 (+),score=97.62 TRINITY_DN16775_c0_g1_i1:186-1142(+)
MGLDYYTVLGVNRDVSDEDLKRSYRKLAMKWHPDKNPNNREHAELKFKEVAESFDVLSDPKKRAVFDQYGEEGLKSGVPDGEGGFKTQAYHFAGKPEQIFQEFFGSANPYADFSEVGGQSGFGFGDTGFSRGARQPPPIEKEFFCTFEELYNGSTKKMKITKRVLNADQKTTSTQDKYLTLDVKKGWKKGTKITFAKEGDEGAGIIPADVIFILNEKPHPRFKRSGNNLIYEAKVSLAKALTGCTIEINTLDDRKISIPIADIVDPKYEKVVPNEGMPLSKDPTRRGNLIIRFKIQFPHYLTEDQKKTIKNTLEKGQK